MSITQIVAMAIAASFIVGFGAGFYTKARFVKADQAVAAEQRVVAIQKSEADARKEDARIATSTQQSDDRGDTIKQELKHVPVLVQPRRKSVVVRTKPAPVGKKAGVTTQGPAIEPTVVDAPAPAPDVAPEVSAEVVVAPLACPDPVLSVGAVQLLNAARLDQDPQPGSDAQSGEASDVTVPDLLDNDAEVVKRYHTLAKRHDALVDWVNGEISKTK